VRYSIFVSTIKDSAPVFFSKVGNEFLPDLRQVIWMSELNIGFGELMLKAPEIRFRMGVDVKHFSQVERTLV
jgi:hypothetical protein